MGFLLFLLKLLSFGCATLWRVVTARGTKVWTSACRFRLLKADILENKGIREQYRLKFLPSPPAFPFCRRALRRRTARLSCAARLSNVANRNFGALRTLLRRITSMRPLAGGQGRPRGSLLLHNFAHPTLTMLNLLLRLPRRLWGANCTRSLRPEVEPSTTHF